MNLGLSVTVFALILLIAKQPQVEGFSLIFLCLFVCLSICLFVNWSVCTSIHLYMSLSVLLSVCLSVCLSVWTFAWLSVLLFVCHPSLSVSVYLSIFLSVCLSFNSARLCLSNRLSIHISICHWHSLTVTFSLCQLCHSFHQTIFSSPFSTLLLIICLSLSSYLLVRLENSDLFITHAEKSYLAGHLPLSHK